MSSVAAPAAPANVRGPEPGAPIPPGAPDPAKGGMSTKRKITLGILAVYVIGLVVFGVAFGVKAHRNESFDVVGSFHLESWFHIGGPLNFDKGVLYLLIASTLTVGIVLWTSKRMQMRPGRMQMVVESTYELAASMTRENMDERMARKWFPLVYTLFVFILVTNLIGYIPLPVDSAEKFNLFGVHVPAFQIYAADTNLAIPLLLALGVFIAYNVEGVRHHGFFGYIKSLVPSGLGGAMLIFMYPLEILSNFLRLISLTVRLWANLLAGHLLIEFMSGLLAVVIGLQILGWFTLPIGVAIYLFEAVLIAGLQAFIFAILTAIYLGGATQSH
ncbi:MAG TPA: F0F1 ATP synthase subunit A [Solirubrobacteraceae bacterium]|jgi:F-type H+-transporting ATPase subunit a|nr:F0F1 ATP synthase subunit A [Solirubrobacteraceae bacterium]